jgi:threonine/homoserine efflux transporter RhtA
MLACVEPLFAALLAIILLGQLLSVTEWLGFFIVLTSIYSFEKNSANLKPQSK